MIRIPVDPRSPDPAGLGRAVEALDAGLIVAFPTDTLYGLAVDPRREDAVERLYLAKARPAERASPLIAADLAQVETAVGRMTEAGRRLAARFWPGPLTLVIEAHAGLAPGVHAGTGKVAVRVPAHDVARALARRAGRPITATSANRSGQPPAATADEVAAVLSEAVEVLLDSGPTPGGLPSTIVDVTGGQPALVREGAVAWARVLESLQ